MEIKEFIRISKEKLKNKGLQNPSLDIKLLLSYILHIDSKNLIFNNTKKLTKLQTQKLNTLINRRLKKEPISRIIGKKEFWDFEFTINKNTLDPRPDSETLIEAVLKIFKNKTENKFKILDLGTGSGCLILTLLKLFPNSIGIGTDINLKTLKIAKQNAKNLNTQKRVKFVQSNWNENITEKFNIIISNPPYIPTKQIQSLPEEVKNFDPHIALDGGENGLKYYQYIAKNISKNLAKNGYIFLEIGQNQENDIINIFQKNNFKLKFAKKDLSGIIRVLCFQSN